MPNANYAMVALGRQMNSVARDPTLSTNRKLHVMSSMIQGAKMTQQRKTRVHVNVPSRRNHAQNQLNARMRAIGARPAGPVHRNLNVAWTAAMLRGAPAAPTHAVRR